MANYTDEELKYRFEARERYTAVAFSGSRRHVLLFEPYNVSPHEYRVLSVLFISGGCEPSVIADKLNTLRQTMTKILDGLEAKKLVLRTAHPSARRRVFVKLLPEGEALARELLTLETDYNLAIENHFEPGEYELYRKLFQKLQDARDEELHRILEARKQSPDAP